LFSVHDGYQYIFTLIGPSYIDRGIRALL
jgi:hypothetical protein